MMSEVRVEDADWPVWGDRLTELRSEVFVVEQNVPVELEVDGLDSECRHVVALHGDQVVGTARLLPTGFIGRMCVKREYRGRGIGGLMLSRLITVARSLDYPGVALNAQSQVIEFYQRHGFVVDSQPFMEAGILHQKMILKTD